MKLRYMVVIALFVSVSAQADSVHEWGHWQSDQSARKQISEGADPTEVTEASEAGLSNPGLTTNFSITPDNPSLSPEGLPRLGGKNASTLTPVNQSGVNNVIDPISPK